MPAVRHLHGCQHTRHADAQTGAHRLAERHRLSAFEKAIGLGGSGRSLATVVGGEALGSSVEMHDEGAAPDAGRLRLHEVEDKLHGYGRIDRTAAATQD